MKENVKVLYLCDGRKEDCKKEECYKNNGMCRHTDDICHAENFNKKYSENFWEKEK